MLAPPLNHCALHNALEAAGRRCTPLRMAVYDQLCRAKDHPSAEEIDQSVKTSIHNLCLATVDNALEVPVAAGLAAKLTAGDGSARDDARGDHHDHLRCLRSGIAQDLPTTLDPDLIEKLDPDLLVKPQQQGFRMTGYRLELVGFFDAGTNKSGSPGS